MQHEHGTEPQLGAVALVCSAPRLRRFLRLALEADGQRVLEWTNPAGPPPAGVGAVVVDLDSLGWTPPAAVGAISAVGVPNATPLLLITVYPFEPNGVGAAPGRRLGYLQPPFGPGA